MPLAAPRRFLLPVFGALLAACAVLTATPASAYPGAPWFQPSKTYTSNFPDPSVLRVGNGFVAYGTSTGGAYLPAMTSTDLRTWTARPAYDPGRPLNSDPYFNDALPYPASWGADRATDNRMKKEVWAPGVAKIGSTFVAFYTVRTRITPARFCISVATSGSALGPFTDRTTGPLVCGTDPAGAIDPAPFVDPATGRAWLTWKTEGVPGRAPSRLWSRQLNPAGTGFAAGSTNHALLATALSWEGNLIENPSMIRWNGALWLFYSANEWRSGNYATGYAKCSSPAGPCKRATLTPFMRRTSTQLGQGAASAFLGLDGRLRLAYQYWNAPYTDYPAYPDCLRTSCTNKGQRRMAIATLGIASDGHLKRIS
ncbi:MAG: glycoside hydrolase family 43 protein [Actinobacteria bacterium]|nr:glycoside hydrolase family 43 protein [Actinomycetota bacterium]